MTERQLSKIKTQCECYVKRFAADGADLPRPLYLKKEHCRRVAKEARDLSADLGWSAPEQHSAEAVGLLHDMGRFSQFTEFGTFADAASLDHGERGATVIEQAGWLSPLLPEDRRVILDGVRYHNRLAIPDTVHGRHLAFLRLVRDADKLDILGIVLDAVDRDGFRELPGMLPHVRLDRAASAEIVEEILRYRRASMHNVRSLADLLLLQMSWVYDLNYDPTFQRFHKRHILSRILKHLDGDARIHALAENVNRFVLKRISNEATTTYGS